MPGETRNIPIKEGLWIAGSSGEPRLLGKRCLSCGELFAPGRAKGICIRCQQRKLQDVELSPLGTIVSFTAAMQPPAGGFYCGPVPYCYGLVDLDDGVRIETQLGGDVEQMRVGGRVRLAIETLYQDQDGNEVQVFRFQAMAQQAAPGGGA